ncbi:hypothetical protein CYMTET_33174 [Cymbomonas tetramitiformis]|uniref:Uncharacterized protein n=1 Tax=Cymbomonas tetramitiformis TaxID=36881 RepID=A0AAE0FDE9_9CHLO|nr:hypothetical protein CYMTET_33174 [Cymbomonas tetramitiformis]
MGDTLLSAAPFGEDAARGLLGPFYMAAAIQPVIQATLDAHLDVYVITFLYDDHIVDPQGLYPQGHYSWLEEFGVDLSISKPC